MIRACRYLSGFIKFKPSGVRLICAIEGGLLNNFSPLLFCDFEKLKNFEELFFALEIHWKQNINVY